MKAWNGQLLLTFLDLCLEVLNKNKPADVETALACMCTRSLVCWYDRLARYPRLLSPQQGRDIAYYGFRFVRLYHRLAIHGVINKINRWKLSPKLHAFRHMQEDMCRQLYNYRYCHTYKDEDFVGVMKRLCVRVSKSDLMEFRILTRFLLRLASWKPKSSEGGQPY